MKNYIAYLTAKSVVRKQIFWMDDILHSAISEEFAQVFHTDKWFCVLVLATAPCHVSEFYQTKEEAKEYAERLLRLDFYKALKNA